MKVFVEASAHSTEKGMFNEKTFERIGTREALLPYPYPYGFVTGTCGDDGEAVDCYIITNKTLEIGEMVDCKPAGYLEFNEDGEEDHKVLVVLSDEDDSLKADLRDELTDFIYGIFRKYPEADVRVGQLRSREEAVAYLVKYGLDEAKEK